MSIRIYKFKMNLGLVILAGGRSKRMGADKAFLKIGKRPLVENIAEKLKFLFDEITVIANKDISRYKKIGLCAMRDMIPGKGPLSGIHAGLKNTKAYYIFVTACDMPFVNIKLVKHLFGKLREKDEVVVCKVRGRYEPLFAIYGKGCIGAIEEQLASDDTKVTGFFSKVKVRTISQKEVKKIDPKLSAFKNINTPSDYKKMTNNKAQNSK